MWKSEIMQFYEQFIGSFNHCGTFLLDATDDDIAYMIFEEFEIEVFSLMCKTGLNRLIEAKLIDTEVYELCTVLRDKVNGLRDAKIDWEVESVRTSPRWREIMELTENIRALL